MAAHHATGENHTLASERSGARHTASLACVVLAHVPAFGAGFWDGFWGHEIVGTAASSTERLRVLRAAALVRPMALKGRRLLHPLPEERCF
mmetsp:Transcript_30568/g.68682  ORF Transcript_30568/g.68682 Transcript_30568/m.68682 type:complete len:91 (+) Transcript_30568:242-514(+)